MANDLRNLYKKDGQTKLLWPEKVSIKWDTNILKICGDREFLSFVRLELED